MATVYRARRHGRREPVALKVAHAGMGSFLKDETAFLKALKLDHPHIIRIIPTPIDGSSSEYIVKDPESGSWYFAMEFMAGGSLEDWMQRRKRVSLSDAVDVVRQVGSALDAAHRAGLVHLDVKPSNVLFRNKPEKGNRHAVLTDFGIARPHGRAGRGQTTLTVEYASPEQVRLAMGEQVHIGPASDLYSLAMILYEMISGRLPHEGMENELATMHKIVYEPMPLPVPNGPPELTPVMERALAKDPTARHPSCQSLTAELETLPASAYRSPSSGRRLHPAVSLLVGLGVGLGGGFTLGRFSSPPPPMPGVTTVRETVEVTRVVTVVVTVTPTPVERLEIGLPTATPAQEIETPTTRPPTSTPEPTATPAPRPTSTPIPSPTRASPPTPTATS